MSAQIIEKDGKAEFAVVPIDEYTALLEKAEDLDDVVAYDKAVAELEAGEDELIPAEFADRLMDGDEHPLKVWREFRGLTQEQLAERAEGVSQAQIAQIETGARQGTVAVLKSLAGMLDVALDDLVAD